MSKVLIIRADCSLAIGTGHVMRMIALGQAWQALGGDVHIIGQVAPLKDRLETEGFTITELDAVHPSPKDVQALIELSSDKDWIAIDGYHFDSTYQKAVRNNGRKTLVLDDFFDRGEYHADILLNQNPDGPQYPYDLPGGTLLLGSKYAMLRKDFHRPETPREIPKKATNLLVTMGGADPDNITGKVLDAIKATGLPDLHVRVVAGAANPHLDDLAKKIKGLSCSCELMTGVNNMPSLMAETDLAVSAGGTTSWELCYFGVPFIAIEIADNQQGVIRELRRHGAARCLTHPDELAKFSVELTNLITDKITRSQMCHAGQKLVDGKGAMRVAGILYASALSLRPATMADAQVLLRWRNHPEIKKHFFDKSSISWEQHIDWFKKRLADPNCLFYIGLDNQGTCVGQIRFDKEKSIATVSVNVAPERTGLGIGKILTRKACQKMQKIWPNVVPVALVKKNNPASLAMFSKAGFRLIDNGNKEYSTFKWYKQND